MSFESVPEGIVPTMIRATSRILQFRGLLATLVNRELKARYRGSVLGFFWSLINPLLLLGVYTFVFSFVFRPRIAGAEPYALFLMAGLFPWIWISGSLLEGTQSLVANAGMIRKAVFPAEILPIVSVLANLVHFLLALPVLGGALVVGRFAGFEVGGWWAVLLPAVIVLQLPLLGGLCLGLAALNVHFKDVKDIVTNLLTLWFFLTPILYPLEAVSIRPLYLVVAWLNPFTPFIRAYQALLFDGVLPPWELWLQMLLWGAAVWAVGSWLFERLSESLAEAV